MNNITNLYELLHVGAKVVRENLGNPIKTRKQNSNPGWEIRIETQIRNLRQEASIIKQKKNSGTGWDEKRKSPIRLKQKHN